MKVIKKLWAQEPVIVRGVLSLAVSAGVLTATQASVWGNAISGVVVLAGLLLARSKVKPDPK